MMDVKTKIEIRADRRAGYLRNIEVPILCFQKKTGLKGEIPQNYEQLKEEIRKWPRIGMIQEKKNEGPPITRTGF
jgi:hypothetical protein